MDISERYRIVVGGGPEVDWCDVFNTEAYFRLHPRERSLYFKLVDEGAGEAVAVAHFSEVEPGVFQSPARGTYGGFELRPRSFELVGAFVGRVEERLRGEGARKIVVYAPPFSHDRERSSHLFQTLFARGYSVCDSDLSFFVPVTDGGLVERMRHNNRKRYRKCRRAGFTFTQCPLEKVREIYDVIAENRAVKGFSLSMTFEQVREMVEAFPERIFLFAVDDASRWIAGALCLQLSPRVLYAVYWGDLPGYQQHSPVTLLADGIYRFARDNGYEVLDVGTAPVGQDENCGLLHFKENLGCRASLKITYSRTF